MQEKKVDNLKIHDMDIRKKYAIKGAVTGLAISAIPIGLAVAHNVFGMDNTLTNAGFYGEIVNPIANFVTTWPGALASSGIFTAGSVATALDKAEEKISKTR